MYTIQVGESKLYTQYIHTTKKKKEKKKVSRRDREKSHLKWNMALLLRKDVQKASYYVWFLGAEESRALRGTRILLSAIPYIVDRSQEIDPIKVTLQVSHKGMKIVQVRDKLILWIFFKLKFNDSFFRLFFQHIELH